MRIRITALLVVIGLAPANSSPAQQGGITLLPDSVVTRIDRGFASIGAGVPGCAIGMSRDGRTVLTRAYGSANLEYSVPNTPETVFESGSVAKQFTAAAVMVLVQEGKLSLDDDIRKHLPEVPAFGKTITIRHLLTHTSGLRDQWGLLSIKGLGAGTQVHTLNTILDLVARQKSLNFDPGAEYLYSNTGYVLSAIIVHRASGLPFAEFMKQRLFAPLDMTNTQWRDDFRKVVKNRATAYDRNAQGAFEQDMPFTNVHGNGGLLTTVGDLLLWNAFLDAPSVIGTTGAAVVQAMTTPMQLNGGKRITYALGLDVTAREGLREISHSGSTAGYRTWLARYPDERTSVAVLCNAGAGANAVALGTMATLAALGRQQRPVAQAAPGMATPSAAELERYVGLYRGPNPELLAQMVVRNGQLVAVLPSNRPLVPVAPDHFRLGANELAFRMANGNVRQLLQINAADTTTYDPIPLATPTPKTLLAYAGSYWSEELETRFHLSVRDTVLVLKRRPADEVAVALRPTFVDGFSGPPGTMEFSRDTAGRVTGFGLWAGRVRNVRFVKEK